MTIELAYIGVEVAHREALAATLSDIVGLTAAVTEGDEWTWRNDQRVQRVLVTEGPANDATVIGFEWATLDEAVATVERLEALGCNVSSGDAAQCSARQVDAIWTTTAPWGVPVEIVVGLASAAETFASALMPGGFKTDGMGFGHCVFMVSDADEAHRFVVDGLGLRQTDWLDLQIAPGFVVSGRFYHGNPRHHSLALICPPGPPAPQKLHHFMVETHDRNDVGAAFDRAYGADYVIPNGLGQHDNDKMFSFYLMTAAGFQIEVGHGAREVGPDWSENRSYDRSSAWGHQPVGRPG
jgi:2,3-dihydroxybiphenyl 1,2-dioxygenase